ncbi:DUF937 domain-containing protein [Pedobacter foliorum]|uniref:DUF937 domain-containing protein n=1 Tax=Pedobacter foliorum TaxID=2739058 RepID=UPI001565B420|nr:DUF937 domain-containing protein [Pedobacter foliorum]NRF38770.1 hypothetical protein [Pedobacter foliorum]
MIENLKQLVTENVQDAIVNNSEVPNEQNEAAISAASGSIIDALKEKLSSGDIAGLVDTFKSGNVSSVVEQASSGFTEKLAGLGINLDSAKNIAASIIPGIMEKFVNKTNDPNDSSFNFKDVIGHIAGPDGKFDLSDITGMFTGNKDAAAGEEGKGDGIIDKLKGLFN